jgi:hypothetical protein
MTNKTNETYAVSTEEAQTLNIKELVRHSSGLTLKLGLAEREIGQLLLAIERLEDGKMALKLKLEDANGEIARLVLAQDADPEEHAPAPPARPE